MKKDILIHILGNFYFIGLVFVDNFSDNSCNYPWFFFWILYKKKYHGSHFSKVKLYGRSYLLIFVEAGVTILVCLGFLHILGKLRLFTALLTLLLAIFRSSALRRFASPYLFLLLPLLDIVYPFYVVNFF